LKIFILSLPGGEQSVRRGSLTCCQANLILLCKSPASITQKKITITLRGTTAFIFFENLYSQKESSKKVL
jgi:hypothetical protein